MLNWWEISADVYSTLRGRIQLTERGILMNKKVAVVAIGGNSLIKDKEHQTVPDQFAATQETCVHIAGMIEHGWDVIITHGNVPRWALSSAARSWPATSYTPCPWILAGPIPRGPSVT